MHEIVLGTSYSKGSSGGALHIPQTDQDAPGQQAPEPPAGHSGQWGRPGRRVPPGPGEKLWQEAGLSHGSWERFRQAAAIGPTGSSPFLGSWGSDSDVTASSGSSQCPARKRDGSKAQASQVLALDWFRLRLSPRNAMAGKQRPGESRLA